MELVFFMLLLVHLEMYHTPGWSLVLTQYSEAFIFVWSPRKKKKRKKNSYINMTLLPKASYTWTDNYSKLKLLPIRGGHNSPTFPNSLYKDILKREKKLEKLLSDKIITYTLLKAENGNHLDSYGEYKIVCTVSEFHLFMR